MSGGGDNGNEEEQGSCRLMPLFLSFLKSNPGVTLDASSILAHKAAGPKLPHEPRRLLEKSESGPWSNFWRFLSDARTQMGRTLWALLQEKQQRPHPLFKMNPLWIFQNVRYAWGFEDMRSLYPVICLWEKKEGWAWLGALAREKEFLQSVLERAREKKTVPAAALEHFSSTEQRQESVDVKWLNRPGRGRKVQKGTSIRVPVITPSLCTLPSPLLNFPRCPSLWQKFKWVKSKPADAHCLGRTVVKKKKKKKPNQTISVLEYGQRCCCLLDVTGKKPKGFHL